jgi:hypothetical protein
VQNHDVYPKYCTCCLLHCYYDPNQVDQWAKDWCTDQSSTIEWTLRLSLVSTAPNSLMQMLAPLSLPPMCDRATLGRNDYVTTSNRIFGPQSIGLERSTWIAIYFTRKNVVVVAISNTTVWRECCNVRNDNLIFLRKFVADWKLISPKKMYLRGERKMASDFSDCYLESSGESALEPRGFQQSMTRR